MTIAFEKLKARLLANPKVKAEYDALAPEFEIAAELVSGPARAGSRAAPGHQSHGAAAPRGRDGCLGRLRPLKGAARHALAFSHPAGTWSQVVRVRRPFGHGPDGLGIPLHRARSEKLR